jgi:hypothetical protein
MLAFLRPGKVALVCAVISICMSRMAGGVEGQPSQGLIWSIHPHWKGEVEWVLHQLEVCKLAVDDETPCNRFVGEALERIYRVSDFARANNQYASANEIVQLVEVPKNKWQLIGRASDQSVLDRAQTEANAGYPVLAVRPDSARGHVALIIPGELTVSTSWDGAKVPNSASFLYKDLKGSYIGKGLSFAFSKAKRPDVKIYRRIAATFAGSQGNSASRSIASLALRTGADTSGLSTAWLVTTARALSNPRVADKDVNQIGEELGLLGRSINAVKNEADVQALLGSEPARKYGFALALNPSIAINDTDRTAFEWVRRQQSSTEHTTAIPNAVDPWSSLGAVLLSDERTRRVALQAARTAFGPIPDTDSAFGDSAMNPMVRSLAEAYNLPNDSNIRAAAQQMVGASNNALREQTRQLAQFSDTFRHPGAFRLPASLDNLPAFVASQPFRNIDDKAGAVSALKVLAAASGDPDAINFATRVAQTMDTSNKVINQLSLLLKSGGAFNTVTSLASISSMLNMPIGLPGSSGNEEVLAEIAALTQLMMKQFAIVNSKLDHITAQLDAIAVKLDAIARDINRLQETIDIVRADLASLSADVARLDRRLSTVEENIINEQYRIALSGCFSNYEQGVPISVDGFLKCLDTFSQLARSSASETHSAPAPQDVVELERALISAFGTGPIGPLPPKDWGRAASLLAKGEATFLGRTDLERFAHPSSLVPNQFILDFAIDGYTSLPALYPGSPFSAKRAAATLKDLRGLATRSRDFQRALRGDGAVAQQNLDAAFIAYEQQLQLVADTLELAATRVAQRVLKDPAIVEGGGFVWGFGVPLSPLITWVQPNAPPVAAVNLPILPIPSDPFRASAPQQIPPCDPKRSDIQPLLVQWLGDSSATVPLEKRSLYFRLIAFDDDSEQLFWALAPAPFNPNTMRGKTLVNQPITICTLELSLEPAGDWTSGIGPYLYVFDKWRISAYFSIRITDRELVNFKFENEICSASPKKTPDSKPPPPMAGYGDCLRTMAPAISDQLRTDQFAALVSKIRVAEIIRAPQYQFLHAAVVTMVEEQLESNDNLEARGFQDELRRLDALAALLKGHLLWSAPTTYIHNDLMTTMLGGYENVRIVDSHSLKALFRCAKSMFMKISRTYKWPDEAAPAPRTVLIPRGSFECAAVETALNTIGADTNLLSGFLVTPTTTFVERVKRAKEAVSLKIPWANDSLARELPAEVLLRKLDLLEQQRP